MDKSRGRLLSLSAAADRIAKAWNVDPSDVPIRTLRYWADPTVPSHSRFPAFKPSGKERGWWAIYSADLDAWLQRDRRPRSIGFPARSARPERRKTLPPVTLGAEGDVP